MPPPGTTDLGSDDPASESSDTATSDPKTYLVMSGGEGYIDFRMGEYITPLMKPRGSTKCIHLAGAKKWRLCFPLVKSKIPEVAFEST